MKDYRPNKEILKKYAQVLVDFALNSGCGVKKGEVVQCLVPDVAKPLMVYLQEAILKAGGQPMMRMLPTGLEKSFYELANDEQLTFFPKKYLKERVALVDHSVGILAEHDLYELAETDPGKIMKAAEAKRKYKEWRDEKEYAGKFTWTLAMYGTGAMAQEAGMSLRGYWDQIIRACFLDKENPIGEWKKIMAMQEKIKRKLNKLPVRRLHVTGKNVDLWLTLGEKRQWVGGSGRNIPSFEIFTSPDWRGTEGIIYFNQPLYRYGNIVRGARLEFVKGKVVKASAETGGKLLKQIVERPEADRVGEFSLTDARMSRITKFMANTLYDENMGGKYGNTHIAVGMSYKDAYAGDPRKVGKFEWKQLGFNWSAEHTDIISTEDRVVTAELVDERKTVIYKKGQFVV